MVQLVNLAIRLRVVNRKAFDEDDPKKKTFSYKDADGDIQDTGCTTASDLAEWFDANDLVPAVVEAILAKAAKSKGIDIPEEVKALANPAAAPEDVPAAVEPKSE